MQHEADAWASPVSNCRAKAPWPSWRRLAVSAAVAKTQKVTGCCYNPARMLLAQPVSLHLSCRKIQTFDHVLLCFNAPGVYGFIGMCSRRGVSAWMN